MLKILVVEDTDIYTKIFKIVFNNIVEYDITFVQSLIESKKILCEQYFDVVTIDLRLIDGLGAEIIEYIRKDLNNNSTNIIGISSESNEQIIINLYKSGIDFYFQKPFNPQILKALVDRIGNRKRLNIP